jgi:hypothetical protein
MVMMTIDLTMYFTSVMWSLVTVLVLAAGGIGALSRPERPTRSAERAVAGAAVHSLRSRNATLSVNRPRGVALSGSTPLAA